MSRIVLQLCEIFSYKFCNTSFERDFVRRKLCSNCMRFFATNFVTLVLQHILCVANCVWTVWDFTISFPKLVLWHILCDANCVVTVRDILRHTLIVANIVANWLFIKCQTTTWFAIICNNFWNSFCKPILIPNLQYYATSIATIFIIFYKTNIRI